MALTSAEIQELKYELGQSVLGIGADPYVGIRAVFDQVVLPYLLSGAITTCSVAVVASSTPQPVALLLASATGFAAGNSVVIDVDSRQEQATVESISGSTITCLLSFAHAGTYPVTVDGGEAIVRNILRKLRLISQLMEKGFTRAGIKKVDEIEFFDRMTVHRDLASQRSYWRGELGSALFGSQGVMGGGGGGGSVSVY